MNKEIIKNLSYVFGYKGANLIPYIYIEYEKAGVNIQGGNDQYGIEFELNDSTSYLISDFIVDLEATLNGEKKHCNFGSDIMMLFVNKNKVNYISCNFYTEDILIDVPSEFILKMMKYWNKYIKEWEEKTGIEYEGYYE